MTERVEPRDEGDAEVDGQHAVHEPLAPAKHRPRRDSSLADGAPPRQGPRTSKVSQPPRDATRPPAAPRRVHPRVPRGVELDVSDPHERFPERHPQRAALAYASRPRVEKIRGVSVQPSRQQPMRRLPLGRSTHHRVRPPVAIACKEHTKAEMCAIAEEIGIPFAPVATTEDLYDDPQLNAEGRMCETILPNGKSVKLPRIPVEVGDHQFELRRQPPEIGEHTREVLSELGYDENDVTTLEESGAVKSR